MGWGGGGGDLEPKFPFPCLSNVCHAGYHLTFLYGTYIIAVHLSVTDWPAKSEMLEKIF